MKIGLKSVTKKQIKELVQKAYDKGYGNGYNQGYKEANELTAIKETIQEVEVDDDN